ncbi:MAG: 50S ribosomal protein L32 [Candidatus Omnitrophota bacterium]
MALPKRKHSKARRDKSRTHQVLSAPQVTKCPQCFAFVKTHCACPSCGYYKGRKVLDVKVKEEKKK